MPYSASTLSLVGSVNGQAVWHYRNTDSLATICASGYFNTSAAQFQAGDVIYVSRTGTNYGMTELRVVSATATAVAVMFPRVESQAIALPVTAVTNTDFTLPLPPCTIMRATTMTTTAYTAATITAQLGTTSGGVDIVAAASIKSAGVVAHTVIGTAALFAGGTLFVRLVQGTPTAVGAGVLSVEYVPT